MRSKVSAAGLITTPEGFAFQKDRRQIYLQGATRLDCLHTRTRREELPIEAMRRALREQLDVSEEVIERFEFLGRHEIDAGIVREVKVSNFIYHIGLAQVLNIDQCRKMEVVGFRTIFPNVYLTELAKTTMDNYRRVVEC